jgi:hypothetical protein
MNDLATVQIQREKLNQYIQEILLIFMNKMGEDPLKAQMPAHLLSFLGFDDTFVEEYQSRFPTY